jgi:hypothetical protein
MKKLFILAFIMLVGLNAQTIEDRFTFYEDEFDNLQLYTHKDAGLITAGLFISDGEFYPTIRFERYCNSKNYTSELIFLTDFGKVSIEYDAKYEISVGTGYTYLEVFSTIYDFDVLAKLAQTKKLKMRVKGKDNYDFNLGEIEINMFKDVLTLFKRLK